MIKIVNTTFVESMSIPHILPNNYEVEGICDFSTL
jgi:hypothetical protein